MKLQQKIYFVIFLLMNLFISCKSKDIDVNKIRHNQWDTLNIPDKFNTGADESVIFSKHTSSGYISENFNLVIRTDTKTPYYNLSYSASKNLPDRVTITNYDFSDMNFITTRMSEYSNHKIITFNNCKFKGFRNDAVSKNSSGKAYFVFNHCSFSGNVSSSYIVLNDCKIGGFTTDAMNPLREFFVKNLYVYDLMHDGNNNGTHLDGLQIFGDQRSRNNVVDGKWISKVETGYIDFDNVRFEIPSIYYEGNTSSVNACVMFALEYSDVNSVSFNNLYVNGGGKWYPLYMTNGKNNEKSKNRTGWSHKFVRMTNVYVSNNYGTIFYPDKIKDGFIANVNHHNKLFVTSVWKDAQEKVHLIVSNDTKDDVKLIVKSDTGTYEYLIPHCPSNWALNGEKNGASGRVDTKSEEPLKDSKGIPYQNYRWKDMPFDIEKILPDSPTFIVCYQNDEQIRYVSLDGNQHYFTEIKD